MLLCFDGLILACFVTTRISPLTLKGLPYSLVVNIIFKYSISTDTMTDRGLLLWLDPHRTSLWHDRRASRPLRSCFEAVHLLGMAQQGVAWLTMVWLAVLGPCSAWLTPRISFPQGEWMANVAVKCGFFLFQQYTCQSCWLVYISIFVLPTKNKWSKSRK